MARRTTGAIFCWLAALLFLSRYLLAVLYVNETVTRNAEEFGFLLNAIPMTPWIMAGLCVVVGLGYLVWAEWTEHPK